VYTHFPLPNLNVKCLVSLKMRWSTNLCWLMLENALISQPTHLITSENHVFTSMGIFFSGWWGNHPLSYAICVFQKYQSQSSSKIQSIIFPSFISGILIIALLAKHVSISSQSVRVSIKLDIFPCFNNFTTLNVHTNSSYVNIWKFHWTRKIVKKQVSVTHAIVAMMQTRGFFLLIRLLVIRVNVIGNSIKQGELSSLSLTHSAECSNYVKASFEGYHVWSLCF